MRGTFQARKTLREGGFPVVGGFQQQRFHVREVLQGGVFRMREVFRNRDLTGGKFPVSEVSRPRKLP